MIADRDESDAARDPEREAAPLDPDARRDAQRSVKWRPRCSGCGRWIALPGGAGFGNGKTWCERCAVRLDFDRGDGRAR